MVLGVGSPGVVHVRVLPLTDGSSPGLHVTVLCVGSPGEVQIRPVPSALGDPSSPSSHDMVLGVGSPGVVHVRVLPLTDGSSPGLHVTVLWYWLAWRSTNQTSITFIWRSFFSFITCYSSLYWLAWRSTSKSATSCRSFFSFIT